MNPVDIDGLECAYDERAAVLKGVSARAPAGKVVAIMGGSGSGKTTLLRAIEGQLAPTAGRLSVLGYDMTRIKRAELLALRKKIGVLFQFGGLFTDMTILDNIAFPLREHTQWEESAIRDLALLKLESVGLRGAAAAYPSELSGGMARRVALARAVAMDPQLILYDEPFTGLDPISLAIIARLIRELNDALNATSIIVTHDVAESLRIVDYVYLMWQGEIVGEGAPDEIRDSAKPYVRQFINAAPDGPLPFHHPAPPLWNQLGIRPAR